MSDMSKKQKRKRRRRRVLGVVLALIIVGTIGMRLTAEERVRINNTPVPAVVEPIDYDETTVALIQSDRERAEDITEEEVRDMVREAVALAGGLEDVVANGDVVVLKPNFMAANHMAGGLGEMMSAGNEPHPASSLLSQTVNGISTDYRVAKAVAELVREQNPDGKIYVMEASGAGFTDEKMRILGYTHENIPFVDEFISMDDTGKGYETTGTAEDVVAVDLGEYSLYEAGSGLDHMNGLFYMDRVYYEADVLISLPVLKNHQMAAVTGSVKNVAIGSAPPVLYGGSPDSSDRMAVNHFWDPLQQFIHDYYMLKPADFVVTDGLQSLQNGPLAIGMDSYENALMNKRLVLAGENAVSVDTIHALITGVDPEKVDYFRYLADDGIGIYDTSNINLVGNRLLNGISESYTFPGFPYRVVQPVPRTTVYDDFVAPSVSVSEMQAGDGSVSAKFTADETIIKVELRVNGTLVAVDRDGNNDVNFSSEFASDDRVELIAYDRFLNGAVITLQ